MAILRSKNSISLWRIIFTIVVVMVHCGYFDGGYIAVEFFFLVSGYLLAKSVYEGKELSVGAFVLKRTRRLYPMYFFSMIIFAALGVAVNYSIETFHIRDYLIELLDRVFSHWDSLLMLQVFGPGPIDYNVPAWYVAVLFWVSIIYFILMRLIPKKGFIIFTGITSIAVLIILFVTVGNLDLWETKRLYISEGVLRAYAEIGIGIILYFVKPLLENKMSLNHKIVIAIEVIGYVGILITTLFINHTKWDFLLLIVMSICVLMSFTDHGNVIISNKVFNNISKYTYGVYLNHSIFVILIVVCGVPFQSMPQPVMVIWVLFAAAICAIVGELFIKWVSKMNNRIDRRNIVNICVASVMTIIWIFMLRNIRGSLLTYGIIGAISVIMAIFTREKIDKKSINIVVCIMSVLLSGLVTLGN